MSKKPRVKILISCHKPTAYISNDILTPIQLNCANNKNHIPGMLRDDEGDNISEKNPMYCELTAQYWAWKNLDADYYGFCHYRRYFNFSSEHFEEDKYGNIVEAYPGEFIVEKYGQNEKTILEAIGDNDIVITERKNISKMPGGAKSIREQYANAPLLHAEDLALVEAIIGEKYPEYSEVAKKFLDGKMTSFCNMYILKKAIFFEYCEWMFAVLEEFCKRCDMAKYSTEALRTPGHLSERLFGIFLAKKMQEKDLKIKELQCVYFEKTDPQEPLSPVFKKDAVPVVLAANNGFVPIFATCLQSILETSNEKNNYDIILIQSDVTPENKALLKGMLRKRPNFSLRFYDASELIGGYKLEAKAHISVETYYRFLIQEAMPDYEKVLYIDCDLIVKKDLAKLFSTNIEGYMLAAAYDPDFIGQVNGANSATKEYAENVLTLKDPYAYFQAGVILFNEKEMRKAHTLNEWLEYATYPYRYSDQDVLNIYCQGRVKYIDMAWNMIYDCNHERISKVINFAPDEIRKEYMVAHANPSIVHYAGFMKPWHDTKQEFAVDFWQFARKTPYYEQLLQAMSKKISELKVAKLASTVSTRGKIKDRTKRLYNRIIKNNSGLDRRIRILMNRRGK